MVILHSLLARNPCNSAHCMLPARSKNGSVRSLPNVLLCSSFLVHYGSIKGYNVRPQKGITTTKEAPGTQAQPTFFSFASWHQAFAAVVPKALARRKSCRRVGLGFIDPSNWVSFHDLTSHGGLTKSNPKNCSFQVLTGV